MELGLESPHLLERAVRIRVGQYVAEMHVVEAGRVFEHVLDAHWIRRIPRVVDRDFWRDVAELVFQAQVPALDFMHQSDREEAFGG